MLLLALVLVLAMQPQHAAQAQGAARAACPLKRGDHDCVSCETDQHHRPLENIKPFAPNGVLPKIKGFSSSCTHLLAACRTDGTGSQMQAKISAWAYAQLMGMTYVHVPLSQLDHFNPEDQANITAGVEKFFNLGYDEMTVAEYMNYADNVARAGAGSGENDGICSTFACFNFFNEKLHCWEYVKPLLLRKYRSSPKPKTYFVYDQGLALPPKVRPLTIAIHIRRGDVNLHKATDGDRFNSNEYYIDVIKRIQASLPEHLAQKLYLDIVILSEGQPSDFESIVAAYPTTRLFLNSDLLQSMHTLIVADIMVMARSSLSYVAAIYNEGVVVYDPYWHGQQTTWVVNKQDDASVLINYMNTSSIQNLLINRLKARRVRHSAMASVTQVQPSR